MTYSKNIFHCLLMIMYSSLIRIKEQVAFGASSLIRKKEQAAFGASSLTRKKESSFRRFCSVSTYFYLLMYILAANLNLD